MCKAPDPFGSGAAKGKGVRSLTDRAPDPSGFAGYFFAFFLVFLTGFAIR